MRKYFSAGAFALTALTWAVAFAQDVAPTATPTPAVLIPTATPFSTPTPNPTPTPTMPPVLVSTATPTPTPSIATHPGAGTVSVPASLGGTPGEQPMPSPSSTPIGIRASGLGLNDLGWSEIGSPVFTLEQSVLTALQKNPAILTALEEIKRTKGVIIEIRAQALPQIGPSFTWGWTDPNLNANNFSTFSGATTPPTPTPPGATPTPPIGSGVHALNNLRSDIAYNVKITGSQLIFNYSTFRAIRGTFFQRDSAYFALRNTVDQTIANVKTQFYQIIVNRELIVVQEDSVNLLESQLKDQQNRFEAGTVPRFNVLQAQVQLYNQIPQLIAARNAYRISVLTLAKTLGLDFNPARGNAAPLRAKGELPNIPLKVDLLAAIEQAKRNRPFLKQQRANVLNQIEQVHVAIGSWLPNVTASGGGEWLSNDFNSSFGDVSKGWLTTVTGSWPIWDSGMAWGKIQQQRALLSEQKIAYDDDVRQVELEVQQAATNLQQSQETIVATQKNLETAAEALRLAKARLDAGAGTQLDVLNAQVQQTTAQSTYLQALFSYNSNLAEFARATGTQSTYTEQFDSIAPRPTKTRTYYTGSDVGPTGKPRPVTGFEEVTTTTTSESRTSTPK
jgi:outer membrane protein TolC